jgi:hypothetical protein
VWYYLDKEHSKKSGHRAIRRWMTQVKNSGLECFDTFLSTLENKMVLPALESE